MQFRLLTEIRDVQTIAQGRGIRELALLKRHYGDGRWRKRKGVATVLVENGDIRIAELHWYEAHGVGRVKLKIKGYLD
jgi:hypothetical protein